LIDLTWDSHGRIGPADNDALTAWVEAGGNWFWMILLPAIGFNLFLPCQLSQSGTPGVNRYGSPRTLRRCSECIFDKRPADTANQRS